MRIRYLLLVGAAICGLPAQAQQGPGPAGADPKAAGARAPQAKPRPAPGAAAATVVGRNPSATFLMEEYGIPEADALERIDIQNRVLELSKSLNRENDPAFTDIWIEHVPVFRVVIGFADNSDRKAMLDALDPKLRRHVQLKNMPKSRVQINRDLDALTAALNASGIDYAGGYNLKSQKFVIKAEEAGEVQRLRALVPAQLRGDVQVVVDKIPKNQADPVGVQAGDWLAGGYTVYGSSGAESCTFGFTVTYGSLNRPGILTAAHCKPPGVRSAHGHWVTYDTANPVADRLTGKYDFLVVNTTGLNQDNQIYFEDLNSIPEFPAQGWLSVTGLVTFMNQKVGMVMCKSGMTTGITCGEIVDGNALRNGARGWINVSKTKQRDLTAPGDSGGPWFMYPGTSTNITAAGVHSGATTENCVGTGSTCTATYMPIDYIDDFDTSIRLRTSP